MAKQAREITSVEASQKLLEALAAAGIDPHRPQYSVIGNMTALDRMIVARWIGEAWNNGWSGGTQAEQLKHAYDTKDYFAQTEEELSRPKMMPGNDAPDSGAADASVLDEDTETRTTDRLNHL